MGCCCCVWGWSQKVPCLQKGDDKGCGLLTAAAFASCFHVAGVEVWKQLDRRVLVQICRADAKEGEKKQKQQPVSLH